MSFEQQQGLETDYLMRTYGRKPVEFVRGDGIRLYDDRGTEYLDFLAGIGTVSVGHANSRVVKAIQEQAAKLLHVSNYYYVEGRGELAEKISGLLGIKSPLLSVGSREGEAIAESREAEAAEAAAEPQENAAAIPWKTFFANSGAEAVEGAIKIARKYGALHLGGASTIISAWRSFHGRTLSALAATGQPSKQESFKPLPPGFAHVDLNDVQALEAALDQGVCAVLLECIQGEGGVYPCTEDYLREARRLTAERGILLVIDEVQTGFYRTGSYPFAFQHYGIVPDVVTLAKGLGGGVPIGAVVARGAAANVLEPGDHGSTFGGSPLVIAAANATLDELAAMDAGRHVAEVGDYLQECLKRVPLVIEIRGRGLMVGVELSEPIAEDVVTAALREGLVLNSIGRSILRFLPPLICTKADVDLLVERLRNIISRIMEDL